MKKLLGLLASIAAAGAVTAVPAQAALPEWLSNGKPIPAGVVEPVATSGTLTITLRAATGAPIASIKCKVKDEENIQNTPEGGTDEMTEFVFSGCRAKPSPCPAGSVTELRALGLPWFSLLSAGPPVTDRFFGVALEVACSGATIGIYTGTLAPEVGSSVLIFGAGSGTLSEPKSGQFAEVTGKDKLKGPPKDTKITAS